MFDKYYVLDTNILLEDASKLFTLSSKGQNLIILPETVLDEIDTKKSGFDEINFQARAFARLLEEAEVLKTQSLHELRIVSLIIHKDSYKIRIDILSKEQYRTQIKNSAQSIINDRRILEIAQDAQKAYNKEIIFLSMDMMARTRAISLNIPTQSLHGSHHKEDVNFIRRIEISYDAMQSLEHADISDFDPDCKPYYYAYEFKLKDSDHIILATIQNRKILLLDEQELRNQAITPLNKEQLFLSQAIRHPYYNLVVVEALAGSGKTLLAVSGAMKLLQQKQQRRIIYIRNSIESLDKGEDVGYLPGLDEKFRIYNHPLMDTLEYIIRNNHKKKRHQNSHGLSHQDLLPQEVQKRVEELMTNYAIETMWVGEMRGRTLTDAVVIIDEAQNISNKTMQMILSRIDAHSKVIILGSNKQIDNIYLNRHTNALTTLLNAAQSEYDELNLFACKLTKVLRGPITAWAEKIFTPKEQTRA